MATVSTVNIVSSESVTLQVATLLDEELSSAAPVLEAEAGKVAALGAAAEQAAQGNRCAFKMAWSVFEIPEHCPCVQHCVLTRVDHASHNACWVVQSVLL